MKKLFRAVVFGLFLVGCVLVGGGSAYSSGPTNDLKPVLDDLMQVLADKDLKGVANTAKRRTKIMSEIKRGFDFTEMSKRVLGQTWRDISSEERVHFTALMTKLLENVYVGKLEGYSGQKVEFSGEMIKGKRAQVSTMLVDHDMQIPIHYIMQLDGAKWMVYDINIEGVSLVRNYREQFKSILRTEKFTGLVKIIEEKNRSFLETGQ
ncbi:MlaC/ttg2D family ABC transporter substrate-binding protein [Desulforhopalus singaporensis]|uniref:Phospholipid transport system substrate-binding protein n=1 Tax=Desulforhopalus singaporensis TaxID=91360 RepID=A0A1H0MLT1_9BACT|nr:ABC transporter substrate-binding protein [Desulforhopalus singaporensis]SDO81321.1 phospholipid transport system substrate-binding protein [Desulforhopalus singaporensis]